MSPLFEETAEQAGVHYQWTITGKRPLNILQSIGCGCAFLDYDSDGCLDILLVGPHPALFRGDGKGHFTDVTKAAGLDRLSGPFLGCAVGDYDNDGFPDLYLSAFRGGALLHNENFASKSQGEGRRFQEVTHQAGLASQPWGTSCAFVDADNDGRLDLYIGNYVHFGPDVQPQLCASHGQFTSCGPGEYAAEHGVLYRNEGSGHFRDCTRSWGCDRLSGKTLGIAAAPLKNVGQPALALANDQVPGDLLMLQGAATRSLGAASGMALAADGHVYGGMGIDWGDYDEDGQLDLVIATYQNQAKAVFRSQGETFVPQDTARLGMFSSVPYVAFGVKWLDFDNDGRLDLLFSNGHVMDNIAAVDVMNGIGGGAAYRQPMILYHNQAGERFEDVSAQLGSHLAQPIVGRGLATGDYDNDGRMDALAVDGEGKPLLLHNVSQDPQTGGPSAWLLAQLVGRKSNRDGYGARITVECGGRVLRRHVHADGSYLSSSDKRVHFGLGTAQHIDRLAIEWPSGQKDTYRNLPVRRILTLREGAKDIIKP